MERNTELLTLDRASIGFGVTRRRGLGSERKLVKAVNEVSFSVRSGESFGIVGESGSGKSTLARLIMGLENVTAGSITYDNKDVTELCAKDNQAYWRDVQIVFQDPFSSLNPRMRIGSILAEPLRNYGAVGSEQIEDRIQELLRLVGLPPAAAGRFPHELSGGQRQRVAIAAAIAMEPKVLVADEAVSALDVSVQAQIVNLMMDLRKRIGLTYVFITHDLNLCAYFCDRIAVLYLGQVMELCGADQLLKKPLHPYTQALISAVPSVDPARRQSRVKLTGEIPSPIDPPSGCPFHERCPVAIDRCRSERPELIECAPDHSVACHLVAEQVAANEPILNEVNT